MAATAVSPNNAKIAFKGKAARESPAERDYEAESALRTMQEAEQHQQDPDMVKRVAIHAKKQKAGLDSVMTNLQKRGLVSDKQAAKAEKKRGAN